MTAKLIKLTAKRRQEKYILLALYGELVDILLS